MKHMYKQGWGKTILKFLVFSGLFGVLMGLGFLVLIIWILLAI
jgi:hypothetical protein